jgi:hypothetical protein
LLLFALGFDFEIFSLEILSLKLKNLFTAPMALKNLNNFWSLQKIFFIIAYKRLRGSSYRLGSRFLGKVFMNGYSWIKAHKGLGPAG